MRDLYIEFLAEAECLFQSEYYAGAVSRTYYSILHYMTMIVEKKDKVYFDRIDQSKIRERYRDITGCKTDINKFKKFRELCDYERNDKKRKTSKLFLINILSEMNKFLQQQQQLNSRPE